MFVSISTQPGSTEDVTEVTPRGFASSAQVIQPE